MGSAAAEVTERIRSCMDQMVAALRTAAAAVEKDGLSANEMTDVLRVALSSRNRYDAALTGAVGALDRVAEKAPDGELTMGLTCATWLSHNLQISSSAAYAQVRLARHLPSLPSTAAAFDRGELSPQHAGVIARSVEQVVRGGGDPVEAETMLIQEARERDPRDLFRWGLMVRSELTGL